MIDIRSAEWRTRDPFVIPGALIADERQPRQIMERYGTNRTLVIYCACPHEASAASVARQLRLSGVKLALPLIGGIEAWRVAGFDVEPMIAMNDTAIGAAGQQLFTQ
ncbi:rhodanese-like domain-containing protein [Burkholderia sp. 22088]|uniref:rhodanese-like domain-containing protein n=1 Tax=Burkholderia sp. 22088 TaxID=3453871 RepID=UPI003F847A45